MVKNNFLSIFFSELGKNHIKYGVLRNYKALPDSLGGSDLDILVGSSDVNAFYNVLSKVLMSLNGKLIIRYGNVCPRLCVTSFYNGEWFAAQLDVHEGVLPYNLSSMFSAGFVLDRVYKYNIVSVCNDNDAALIAFLKEVLHNGKCKEKYYIGAKHCWDKYSSDYIDMLTEIYGSSFIKVLSSVLSSPFSDSNMGLVSCAGRQSLASGFYRKIKNIKSKLSRLYRFFSPPGYSVVFLGTDGAGKTTIISAVSKTLNEAVHNELHYEHMRPNTIPSIAALFGKRESLTGPNENPHEYKSSGFIVSLVRLAYYSIDYIFGYWFKVHPVMVKKSSVWIFDRYYYDYFIDPLRARINLPSFVIRFFRFFIPEPDLILCLGAKPEVIHKRKPELPFEEVIRQVNELKFFCENEKRAEWIDTGKDLEASINQALNTIVSKMAARYIK